MIAHVRFVIVVGFVLALGSAAFGQERLTKPAPSTTQAEPISPDLLKVLMADLESGDAKVRLAAIGRLGSYGPGAAPAATQLAELLADEATIRIPDQTAATSHTITVGDAAALALRAIGPAAGPAVEQIFKSGKDKVRERAAGVLVRIKERMDETWAWAIADKGSNVVVRRLAAEQLGKSQGESTEAALIKALQDNSVYVRRAAIDSLAHVGKKNAVAPLIAFLGDDTKGQSKLDTPLGAYAAAALGQIGAPSVPALIAALDDPKFAGKDNARLALVLVRDPKALTLLLEAVRDKNPLVRSPAAEALGQVDAPEVIEAVMALTQDTDPHVRQSAYSALCWIRSARSNDQFVKAAELARKALREDTVPEVRATAAQSLGRWPFDYDKNREALIAALDDSDRDVRVCAAATLPRLKPADSSIKALVRRLHDGDVCVRAQAAESLGRMAGDAREATGEIADLLKDKERGVRDKAATALGYIGDPVAITPLIDALETASGKMDSDNKIAEYDSCMAIRKSLSLLTGSTSLYLDVNSWRQWQRRRSASTQPGAVPAATP